jgi:hypothetical protein
MLAQSVSKVIIFKNTGFLYHLQSESFWKFKTLYCVLDPSFFLSDPKYVCAIFSVDTATTGLENPWANTSWCWALWHCAWAGRRVSHSRLLVKNGSLSFSLSISISLSLTLSLSFSLSLSLCLCLSLSFSLVAVAVQCVHVAVTNVRNTNPQRFASENSTICGVQTG